MKRKIKVVLGSLTIEVCERLADSHLVPVCDRIGHVTHWAKAPKYHAQLKGRPGVWGCGKSVNEAVGDLVNTHAETFLVSVDYIGKQAR